MVIYDYLNLKWKEQGHGGLILVICRDLIQGKIGGGAQFS